MPAFEEKLKREVVTAASAERLVAPASRTISEHAVHVWKVDLSIKSIDGVLSPEENERATLFHSPKDGTRFKTAQTALRLILSSYLDLSPAALTFGQTEYGKPFLTNEEASGLLFNMSQSQDVAMIAVAREREVGIDVEWIRQDLATGEVAGQFLSVAEVYTLSGLEGPLRPRAFFNCWTRKKAYIKALGEGVSMPFDQFDVSLAPRVPAAMLRNRIDPTEPSRWIFHDVSFSYGYAAALVIEASQSKPYLSYFEFSS